MTVDEAICEAEKLLPGTPALNDEEDPRWQAIIVVGEFVKTNPEEVWEFISRWGGHEDEDLRTAIATCLLEHVLEYHFDSIFPRLVNAVDENPLFADLFIRCGKFGLSEEPENAERFDHLQKQCKLVR